MNAAVMPTRPPVIDAANERVARSLKSSSRSSRADGTTVSAHSGSERASTPSTGLTSSLPSKAAAGCRSAMVAPARATAMLTLIQKAVSRCDGSRFFLWTMATPMPWPTKICTNPM